MTPSGRLLVFRLGSRRLALDLATVSEVTELPATWPIPLAPISFIGMMNSHGSLLPLLDLSSYLGTGKGSTDGKALIIDRSIGDLALYVDGVERIVPGVEATCLREAEGPLHEGTLEIAGSEVLLLKITGLLEAIESDLQGIMHTAHAWQEEAT